MSTPSFKNLTQDDFTATTTMLNERIPITGTLISGSAKYGPTSGRAINIKTFSHNMFQSVYDYPYLSSSANHIFDITAGFSAKGTQTLSASATVDVSKKVNVYNQMAQVLVGYDVSGNVRRFDPDGNFVNDSVKMENVVFLNFSRMLVKDEIKKGSFNMSVGDGTAYDTPFSTKTAITDTDSATNYRNNSPAGEYGFLKRTGEPGSATIDFSSGVPANTDTISIIALKADGTLNAAVEFTAVNGAGGGLNFSRAQNVNVDNGASNLKSAIEGSSIANLVSVSDVDNSTITVTQVHPGATGNTTISNDLTNVKINGGSAKADGDFLGGNGADTVGLIYYQAGIVALTSSVFGESSKILDATDGAHDDVLKGNTITEIADGVRHRIDNITFDNVTELNSSIYFCRINHNDFNYSSNPTYLSESKIVVKTIPGVVNQANLSPITYITTVGLYSTNNELMAVAKLSEPLKKTPDNEFTLRVRLDY